MKWGVFKIKGDAGDVREVHVIPCRDDGKPMHPHTVQYDCPCAPRVDREPGGIPIVIHHVEQ